MSDPFEVNKELVGATGNQEFIEAAKLFRDGENALARDIRLEGFALIKQATEGDCKIPKPSAFSVVNSFKYGAWIKITGMGKEEAMKLFIEHIKKHLPNKA